MSDLGPCCQCERLGRRVRNVIMLDRKSPMPGRGWGCVQCGLPPDGALAVLCDRCLDATDGLVARLRFACRGYPAIDGRIPAVVLGGQHRHDPSRHPGEAVDPGITIPAPRPIEHKGPLAESRDGNHVGKLLAILKTLPGDGPFDVDITHELSCPFPYGHGRCDCNPEITVHEGTPP